MFLVSISLVLGQYLVVFLSQLFALMFPLFFSLNNLILVSILRACYTSRYSVLIDMTT